AGVREGARATSRRAATGRGRAARSLEGGRADGAAPHGTADAVLHLHDVCADVRNAAARLRAGVRAEPRDAAGDRLDARDPVVRPFVVFERTAAHHVDLLSRDDDLPVRLLRDARLWLRLADRDRDRAGAAAPRPAVR